MAQNFWTKADDDDDAIVAGPLTAKEYKKPNSIR